MSKFFWKRKNWNLQIIPFWIVDEIWENWGALESEKFKGSVEFPGYTGIRGNCKEGGEGTRGEGTRGGPTAEGTGRGGGPAIGGNCGLPELKVQKAATMKKILTYVIIHVFFLSHKKRTESFFF